MPLASAAAYPLLSFTVTGFVYDVTDCLSISLCIMPLGEVWNE